MRRIGMLLVLAACGCGKEAEQAARQPPAQVPAPVATASTGPQSTVVGQPAPTKAAMLEVPEDKQQLQRLLALGYTVHMEHLHPPGAKECPFNMGEGVVQ